ncbi:MAG: hypothetical protein WD100_01560 [Tistlia sp.]
MAGLLGGASAATASQQLGERVAVLPSDHRQVRLADRLLVNPDPSVRYLFPDKCSAQGEAELAALSGAALIEESFIFLPALCLWIEAGSDETATSVAFDAALLDRLLPQHGYLVVYHLHPGQSSEVADYFPAYRDFLTLALINARFLAEPAVQIWHRAVTALAVFDYSFADAGRIASLAEAYEALGLGPFVPQNLWYELGRSKYEAQYLKAVADCAELAEHLPANLFRCGSVTTELFLLEIRPLPFLGQ